MDLILFFNTLCCHSINPLVTNKLSYPYYLDESTCIFRGIGSILFFIFIFITFFDENHVRKQNATYWATLFAYVP